MGIVDSVRGTSSAVNKDVSPNLPGNALKNFKAVSAEKKESEVKQPRKENEQILDLDMKELEKSLDEMTRGTRYSYSINKKLNLFVVKIIDKKTDSVIKEIPSNELQRVHENIQKAVGILFDGLG